MLPKVITKSQFANFVKALTQDYAVFGPQLKERTKAGQDKFVFGRVTDPAALRLDYDTTLLSPKKYFLPQRETLLKFTSRRTQKAEPVLDNSQKVIVGAHPCDIYATWLLDVVFSSNNQDPNYLSRRERALIIGLDCNRPCDEYSFCHDMGTNYVDSGFDLMMTDIGDSYFVDVGTPAGRQLLDRTPFREAHNEDFAKRQTFLEKKQANFHKRIPVDAKYLPEILEESYDSLVWEAIGRRCFSCGSCNTTCPTCYCFDVTDQLNLDLQSGERQRTMDSCQLDTFAEVAGGENFREQRASRLRHRFFRKAKYIQEAFGRMGCVGCGRCDRNCVAKINSVETYTQIAGSR
jgi:sulfhydrogenase subunit beta (sulfur reductase)